MALRHVGFKLFFLLPLLCQATHLHKRISWWEQAFPMRTLEQFKKSVAHIQLQTPTSSSLQLCFRYQSDPVDLEWFFIDARLHLCRHATSENMSYIEKYAKKIIKDIYLIQATVTEGKENLPFPLTYEEEEYAIVLLRKATKAINDNASSENSKRNSIDFTAFHRKS